MCHFSSAKKPTLNPRKTSAGDRFLLKVLKIHKEALDAVLSVLMDGGVV